MNNHLFAYIYPPDFQKANQHRLANRIFKGLQKKHTQLCECCHRKIGAQTVNISVCLDPSNLAFLGPGVPLYFLFLKYIIILLLIMTIIFMSFSIGTNIVIGDCSRIADCIPDFFNIISIVNKQTHSVYLTVQSYLALAFVILAILFFHLFRFKARQLQKQCDEVIDSPSDYALILRRLPSNVREKDIRELIQTVKYTLTDQERKQSENLKVVKIVLSYQLKEYTTVINQNKEQFAKSIKEQSHLLFVPKQLPTFKSTSNIAVVIFQHQISKTYFIQKPKLIERINQFFCTPCLPLNDFEVKGQKISIERAPQPDDICWENAGITMKGAITRKMSYSMLALFILLMGGAAQYGLEVLNQQMTNPTLKLAINIGNSVMITIFNAIILNALIFTTKKERNQTLTEYQTVLMVKVSIFQFFNAGIFVIASQIAANFNSFSLTNGFCSQITLIMALNAIIPNVTLFIINYTQVINKLFRFLAQKSILKLTQQQLNQLYLGPVIDSSNKYAYIMKTLWLTALYATLVPIVIVISMFGILLNYFIQKILHTKCYSLPNTISSMMFESAIQLLQYFLITFAFGQFIVYFYFYKYNISAIPPEWTVCIFATIVVAFVNSALPMEVINKKIFKIQESSHSAMKYSEVQNNFEVTYEMINPAYKSLRQRKNKDWLGFGSNSGPNSQHIAIQMTNLFNNSGNGNTHQPLLFDLFKSEQPKQTLNSNNNNSPNINMLDSFANKSLFLSKSEPNTA